MEPSNLQIKIMAAYDMQTHSRRKKTRRLIEAVASCGGLEPRDGREVRDRIGVGGGGGGEEAKKRKKSQKRRVIHKQRGKLWGDLVG